MVREAGRKQLQKNLLLIGNVDYDAKPGKLPETPAAPHKRFGFNPRDAGNFHFESLPGMQGEAAAIEKLYHSQLKRKRKASPHCKKAGPRSWPFPPRPPRPRYLHIATHGFFAPASMPSALAARPRGPSRRGEMFRSSEVAGMNPGLLSGLALAGANHAAEAAVSADPNADDGIFTAEEIGTMNLDGVQLVVLSASTPAWARWPAVRASWACSGPFSWPGRGRWWPVFGTCKTRRPRPS